MPSWFVEMLSGLIKKGFYGEIVIHMQNGHIQLVKKTETIKAPKEVQVAQ